MKYTTELQKFIKSHDNWKTLLEAKPHCLKITEDNNLVIFKYNQIESDFSEKIVQESRGIILEKDTWNVVARGFDKFFNHSESHCHPVNFNTAKIQEKIDGSIIKLYHYGNKWNIATNGVINAYQCDLPNVAIYGEDVPKNFGELFTLAVTKNGYKEVYHALVGMETKLSTSKTYIFEVVSLYNKVVVTYPHPDIYHIGTRDNITGEENIEDIGVPHPQQYSFKTLDDVIATAKNLPHDAEGFVVVDDKFNRCKVKGLTYLQLHRLKGEDTPSEKRLLALIVSNEGDEFLSYFPEYESGYRRLEKLYEKFIEKVENDLDYLFHKEYIDRKSFAMEASKSICPAFAFLVYDHKWSLGDFREYCGEMRIENLLKCIKED